MTETATRRRGNNLTRHVVKILGLFTGLEGYGILCSIVKMKLVTLWLHSVGVGLFGVYQTTIEAMRALTELGLRESAVREVARHRDHPARFGALKEAVRRWSRLAGLLGAFLMLGLSPLLGEYVLGDWNRWWGFALLSGVMLLQAMLGGEQAILQGTERFRQLARATMWGTTVALLVSIPMYRWLGLTSVPLSLLVYSLSAFTAVSIVSRKLEKGERLIRLTWGEVVREGRGFVKVGVFMAVASFVVNVVTLIFMSWLNSHASLAEVGFYQGGMTILVRYVGLIFGAIAMEFYPRLSTVSSSRWRMQLYLRHEIGLLLSVLGPVIMLFLLLRGVVVELLYSSEFQVIIPFISWGIFGTIGRAVGTCLGVTVLSHGDGKVYMVTEIIDSLTGLALNILFYQWLGLTGLGIAYVAWYGIYMTVMLVIARVRYRLTLGWGIFGLIGYCVCGGVLVFAAMDHLGWWLALALTCVMSVPGALSVIRQLRKK